MPRIYALAKRTDGLVDTVCLGILVVMTLVNLEIPIKVVSTLKKCKKLRGPSLTSINIGVLTRFMCHREKRT